MQDFDFVVIGAGMAGASAAYELGRHGRVAVLEREGQPGYHTTGRSAATYLRSYGNATIRALTVGAWPFFADPPQGFAEHPLLSPRGALHVGRPDQLEDLDRAAEEARAVAGARRIDAVAVRELVPVLRPEVVGGGVFEPDAMDIDVHALHHGYLRGLRERGGVVLTDTEVRALRHGPAGWLVETRAGAYAAPVVVDAAGAWCDEVAQLAGARPVGLVPKRRTVITFVAPPGFDIAAWPLVIGLEEDFYFKPDAGRLLASPADETPVAPCDVQPEELDVAIAVDRIERVTELKVTRIASKWAGLRSFVEDKTPVVGFDPEAQGFFWLAGQGGYGIETAPSMGRLAAALASGGPVPAELADLGVEAAALSPRRFA